MSFHSESHIMFFYDAQGYKDTACGTLMTLMAMCECVEVAVPGPGVSMVTPHHNTLTRPRVTLTQSLSLYTLILVLIISFLKIVCLPLIDKFNKQQN